MLASALRLGRDYRCGLDGPVAATAQLPTIILPERTFGLPV